MRKTVIALIGTLVSGGLIPGIALSAESGTGQKENAQPYAGQDRRTIKSLSPEDIDDLVNGRGWGLAKAAELNGIPGPTHVLELATKIDLSPSQVAAVQSLFQDMKRQATATGRKLVALEQRLDQEFASGQMTEPRLRAHLTEISETLGNLRFVHLSAHLKMPAVLTRGQISAYNQLRGYQSQKRDIPSEKGHHGPSEKGHHGH